MLARIISGVWLIGLLVSIGLDVKNYNKDPVYIEYIVVDKGQEYAYSKNGRTQHNILIVKDKSTGQLESKNVSEVTHYKFNVGDSVWFEDTDFTLPYVFKYIIGTIVFTLLGYLLVQLANLIYWIITGKSYY